MGDTRAQPTLTPWKEPFKKGVASEWAAHLPIQHLKAVKILRSLLPVEAHLAGWPWADSILKRENKDCNTSEEREITLRPGRARSHGHKSSSTFVIDSLDKYEPPGIHII